MRALAIARISSIVAALSSVMLAPLADGEPTTSRVEVPISQTRLSDGVIRYSVPVSIGGAVPIAAMLDTGSFGLRVMSRSLAPDRYQNAQILRDYAYGSGVVLHGSLARAVAMIGGVATGAPILFQLVQSVGCVSAHPRCPASRISADDYAIGGDGLAREGFEAIIGLSMRAPATSEAAINPLAFVGDRAWIITVPLPGETTPGRLIVNPGPEDRQGFQLAHLSSIGEASGRGSLDLADNELPASLVGSFGMKMDSGDANGLAPFHRYSILFDLKDLTIGVKPRSSD
jgi:hypothetical protein